MAYFRCGCVGGGGKNLEGWFTGFRISSEENRRDTGTIGDFPLSVTSAITISVPEEIKAKFNFNGGSWSANGSSYSIPIQATAVASIKDQKLKINISGNSLSITIKE